MSDTDAIVIGAGVVGLAVARALALSGRSVVVLEAAEAIGTETSSRNSEVVQVGIYYPRGDSQGAILCRGPSSTLCLLLRAPHPASTLREVDRRSNTAELAAIETLARRGAANGVDDLVLISAAEAQAMEPQLQCLGALHSPSTGIVDSHALMLALQGDAEEFGATFAFRAIFGSTARRAMASAGWSIFSASKARALRLRWQLRTRSLADWRRLMRSAADDQLAFQRLRMTIAISGGKTRSRPGRGLGPGAQYPTA